MKKKSLALILVLLLLIATLFTGCGTGESGKTGETGGTAVADDKEVITWVVESNANANTEFAAVYDRFLKNIELLSGGRIDIEHYYAGTLVSLSEITAAVMDGTLDAMLGYGAQWGEYEYAQSLFCSTPGWFADGRDMYAWMKFYGGEDVMNESLHPLGVHGIMITITGMETFTWSDKKVQSIDDILGLKMRMMPIMGDVLTANGASCFFIASNELFSSMERGVIDAMEYSYPSNDITEGYNELAKYYMYPGVHQPSGSQDIYINLDSWNALGEELQEIIYLAASENIMHSWNYIATRDIAAYEAFEEYGNEGVYLGDETVETLIEWSNRYMDELSAKDDYFAKVRESQIEFGKIWFPYKEKIYMPYPDLSRY